MKKKEKKQIIGVLIFIGLIYLAINQALIQTTLNTTFENSTFLSGGEEDDTSSGGGGGGGSDATEETLACEEFNIGQTYRDVYGDIVINQAEINCNEYGKYYDSYSVSGCAWDTYSYTVDCDAAQFQLFESTCENVIEGNWICDNSGGFVGCVCDRSAPSYECRWAEVGSVSYATLPNGYVDWLGTLPQGDYKFTWQTHVYLQNIQIILNSASIERFVSQGDGEYYFEEPLGLNEWGIAIENPHDVPVATDLKLYQRVCEDDPQNWNSDMFDTVHMASGDDITSDEYCNNYCQDDLINPYGGYFTGNADDCEGQDNTYIPENGCCCYKAQPN